MEQTHAYMEEAFGKQILLPTLKTAFVQFIDLTTPHYLLHSFSKPNFISVSLTFILFSL